MALLAEHHLALTNKHVGGPHHILGLLARTEQALLANKLIGGKVGHCSCSLLGVVLVLTFALLLLLCRSLPTMLGRAGLGHRAEVAALTLSTRDCRT